MWDKLYTLRIQTYIKGETKKEFLLEMDKYQMTPAQLARKIIEQHYALTRMESNQRAKKLIEATKSKFDK